MSLTFEEYRKKTRGCFLGKAVGGTLGTPFEGRTTTNSVTYYDPVPTEMVANDDLDLQVVWLESIIENGLPVNRRYLADAWCTKVGYHFDEYGIAIRNLRNKVQPPMSGYYNNRFENGMGAAIRAELWACLAPANPELAVKLALEDGCVDHYGDGVYAIVFIAALESAAFIENDTRKLLDTALSFIPKNSKLASAVKDTVLWYDQGGEMFEIREKILNKYGKCGWEKGIFNWSDAVINLAFTVLAWLYGKSDFSKCICYAVNLGYDTDCTAGIIGSVLAIINPDCIEERWIKPIGKDIVLSIPIVGMHSASTIDGFCDMIDDVCINVQKYYGTGLFSDIHSKINLPIWTKHHKTFELPLDYNGTDSLVCIEPLVVNLVYPENHSVIPGTSEQFKAVITNPSDKKTEGKLTLAVPNGWSISTQSVDILLESGESKEINFYITAPECDIIPYINILRFNFDLSGLRFHCDAGIFLSVPWLCTEIDKIPDTIKADMFKNAYFKYSDSYIQDISLGKKVLLKTNFKLPYHTKAITNIVAQGVPLTVWIDGEKILEHENEYYTPSPHRFDCAKRAELDEAWHEVCIAVDNSECNSRELFFAISNMGGRLWCNNIEWKKPAK